MSGRKRILSDEDKIKNRIEIDSRTITIRLENTFIEKFNRFSRQYKSRNSCILDLIKTHPEFKSFK